MKELIEIVAAFESLCAAGKPAALVTVVDVEGSAYRKPGARMLVAEDGRTWGGVSGGCLERDVARRARGVIDTGRAIQCRYDTSDEDSISPGTSTGCGGAIELYIQRLDREQPGPIPSFSKVVRERVPATLCTPGGLTERLSPPQSLVVFGAGSDVVPLISIAKVLGWHVTVVGSRPAMGIDERCRQADMVRINYPEDPLAGVDLSPESAVVVMTHSVARDAKILAGLRGPIRYLGLLGPRHRTRSLLSELPAGKLCEVDADGFYNPVGLDIGSQTPEEIALAIVAEIQAVIRGRKGGHLRDRRGSYRVRFDEAFDELREPDPSSTTLVPKSVDPRFACPT